MRPIDADELQRISDEREEKYGAAFINLDDMPTLNAIVIPENATNGDVIKAAFPDAKWWVNDDNEIFTDMPNNKSIYFDFSWWSAPYGTLKCCDCDNFDGETGFCKLTGHGGKFNETGDHFVDCPIKG